MSLTVIFEFTLRISSVSQPEAIVADKERHQLWLPSPSPSLPLTSWQPRLEAASCISPVWGAARPWISSWSKAARLFILLRTLGLGCDTTELAVMRHLQHIWWENMSPSIHLFPRSSTFNIATANFSELGSRTKQTSHRINTWTPQQPLLIAPESFAETFCVFWMDLGSAFAEGFLRSYYFPNMHFLLHFK